MLPHIIEQLVGAFTSHLPSWRSQSKGTTKKQQHRNTLFPANSSIIFSTESITGVFRISAANPSVSARCASRNRPDSPSAACRSPARSSAPHTETPPQLLPSPVAAQHWPRSAPAASGRVAAPPRPEAGCRCRDGRGAQGNAGRQRPTPGGAGGRGRARRRAGARPGAT